VFWHLFFLFYLSMVIKKIVKFLCCFLVWIRDFIKNLCKTTVFFKKKLRYLKYKISIKFHRLLFLFYFFSIFGILFSVPPIQTCQNILNIFMVLYCTNYRFYQRILENSWIFIKKIEILWIQNIFRIPSFTIWFFNFLVFLTSSISILPVYGFQKKM